MNRSELENYLRSLGDVSLSYPYGPAVAVYSVGGHMFALIEGEKEPIRLSLRCEPKLAGLLRERYDEVMPGHKLDQKHWNSILITGQLGASDLKDLINLSFQIASELP